MVNLELEVLEDAKLDRGGTTQSAPMLRPERGETLGQNLGRNAGHLGIWVSCVHPATEGSSQPWKSGHDECCPYVENVTANAITATSRFAS